MSNDDFYLYHLKKSSVKNKELFFSATSDIEGSFTGRLDMLPLHTFFIEASKMMRNAVKLYEDGYFDAAFYSVRSAVELSRIVAYFSDVDNPKDSEMFRNWASGKKFPFDSKIKEELESSSAVFQELRSVLGDFFDEQAVRLRAAQKYIHKQGLKAFYERGFTNEEHEKNRLDIISKDFNEFVKNSLAEIALLRLCIDPFPLLLRDPQVMYRVHFESMTIAFSDDMVNKVIGKRRVELYKSTDFYTSHVSHFGENESLSEEIHTFINQQFYDRTKWKIIEPQLHLLSQDDQRILRIFNASKTISRIYASGGLQFYFSNVKSERTNLGFNGLDFQEVKNADSKLNTDYDGAFLSYMSLGDDDYWIEHNGPLKLIDIDRIKKAAEI